MKTPFFLLVATGLHKTILNDLGNNIRFFRSGQIQDKNYELLQADDFNFLVSLSMTDVPYSIQSSADNDNWDIVLLLPEVDDCDKTLEIFKKFNVIQRDEKINYRNDDYGSGYHIAGPFMLDQLDRELDDVDLSPLQNEEGFLKIPHIFAGDPEPEIMAKVEYNPTPEECDLKVKPLLSKVFVNVFDAETISKLEIKEALEIIKEEPIKEEEPIIKEEPIKEEEPEEIGEIVIKK